MGQREVRPGEIIRLAWEAEDRVRAGASCYAHRKLGRRGRDELTLVRGKLGRATVWTVIARRWRAFMGGWIRHCEDGFARHRRRA